MHSSFFSLWLFSKIIFYLVKVKEDFSPTKNEGNIRGITLSRIQRTLFFFSFRFFISLRQFPSFFIIHCKLSLKCRAENERKKGEKIRVHQELANMYNRYDGT